MEVLWLGLLFGTVFSLALEVVAFLALARPVRVKAQRRSKGRD